MIKQAAEVDIMLSGVDVMLSGVDVMLSGVDVMLSGVETWLRLRLPECPADRHSLTIYRLSPGQSFYKNS